MSARRDWTHASETLRRAEMAAWEPPREPHALRVVALLTLGFWLTVGASCAAWVWVCSAITSLFSPPCTLSCGWLRSVTTRLPCAVASMPSARRQMP